MNHVAQKNLGFFYQVVTLITLIILVSAIGGVTLVWMRQQISDTAQYNRRVQNEAAQVERRVRYLDSKIAEVNSPAYLRSKALAMGMVLDRPKPQQIVRMAPIDSRPLIPGMGDETYVAERDPFAQSFDLAVMEPGRRAP
jgi:hypothetical protein